jgi:hypothetical protein
MNEDSSARIVSRLHAGSPRNHGSIPESNKIFVSFQSGPARLLSHSSILFICYRGDVFMRGEKRPVREAGCLPPSSTTVGTKSFDSTVNFHVVLREKALDLHYGSRINK